MATVSKHLFLSLLMCLCGLGAVFLGAAPARAAMEDMPIVKLRSLDKLTARTATFEARVGSTIQYGPLYIKVQACRKAPPIEQPESAAFLQIWEIDPKTEKSEWVFSGWMFASSPALSPMDHPIYDVWVLDCLADSESLAEDVKATPETPAGETIAPDNKNADQTDGVSDDE